jgi:hypothetical protein
MMICEWRLSDFTDMVVHIRENEGDEKAPCGHAIIPGAVPKPYSVQCPECLTWEARQLAQRLIKDNRRRRRLRVRTGPGQ